MSGTGTQSGVFERERASLRGENLSPPRIVAYLTGKGWKQTSSPRQTLLRFEEPSDRRSGASEEPLALYVPASSLLVDHQPRTEELLETLELVERRPREKIVLDIERADLDPLALIVGTIRDARRVVAQAKKDERDAGEELHRHIAPWIWPVVRHVLGPYARSGADDVFQDAFAAVYRGLDGYDENRPLKPWVCTVAKHAAIAWIRKQRRGPVMLGPEDEQILSEGYLMDLDPELCRKLFSQAGLSPPEIAVLHFEYLEAETCALTTFFDVTYAKAIEAVAQHRSTERDIAEFAAGYPKQAELLRHVFTFVRQQLPADIDEYGRLLDLLDPAGSPEGSLSPWRKDLLWHVGSTVRASDRQANLTGTVKQLHGREYKRLRDMRIAAERQFEHWLLGGTSV